MSQLSSFQGYKDPQRFLAPGWATKLKTEFSADYMLELGSFLQDEYEQRTIYPQRSHIFRALKHVDFENIKAVILGQDPYPGTHHANGFAFAVENHVRPVPPSLQNIFKEIAAEFGKPPAPDTSLTGWAEQGVLLLNSVLTVRAGESFSHRNKGWETFTDRVVSVLGAREKPLVFLLWGSAAASKKSLIKNPQHCVLTSAHPSPLSAHRGFLGCGHFQIANRFLQEQGVAGIDWLRTGSEQGHFS